MKESIGDANFPRTADGRVYHVGVKRGEIANRILTVGDHVRARRIAAHFDELVFELTSQRGFTIFTGLFKGVPISVIAIGMGYPMIDFLVREARAVVEGQMIIIRFGSCGTLVPEVPVGSLVTAGEALFIGTDFDYFHNSDEDRATAKKAGKQGGSPYWFSKPIPADKALDRHLGEALQRDSPSGSKVVTGVLHAAADSFYSSQGRTDTSFPDENADLIDELKRAYPNIVTLEMESTHLFHLAALHNRSEAGRSGKAGIHAAAVHMTFAGRTAGDFIQPDQVETLEKVAGKACLETLASEKIAPGLEQEVEGSVWESALNKTRK